MKFPNLRADNYCTNIFVREYSFTKSDYKGSVVINLLTPKQKDILEMAKNLGYYSYPRKIDGNGLAKKPGISKPTLIEHLRKIENKVMGSAG